MRTGEQELLGKQDCQWKTTKPRGKQRNWTAIEKESAICRRGHAKTLGARYNCGSHDW
jgi:hypothetical protein